MIEHDKAHHRFVWQCGKYEAALMYAVKGDILDFYHIYTPDPYRGGIISTSILKHAFEYARENGYRVVTSCPYIAGPFLERLPEYRDLVDEGEFPFVEKH